MPSSNDSKNNTSGKKWVVVQLSPGGEREKNISILERSVKRYIGAQHQLEIFVPATSNAIKDGVRNDSNTMFYMDGYIFIEYRAGINYMKLSETNYFSTVLHTGRSLHLLDDSQVKPLKQGVEKLKKGVFSIGDTAKVLHGTFKGLSGTISFVYDGDEKVQLCANLNSKPVFMDYPIGFLKKIDQ